MKLCTLIKMAGACALAAFALATVPHGKAYPGMALDDKVMAKFASITAGLGDGSTNYPPRPALPTLEEIAEDMALDDPLATPAAAAATGGLRARGQSMTSMDSVETQPPEFVPIDLGTLGGSSSYAYGIDSAGDVVGYSYLSGNSTYHAFKYSGNTMQDIETLGSTWSKALGISPSGKNIVGTLLTTGGATRAFLYTNSVMYNLGTIPGGGDGVSEAYGVNDMGKTVGDDPPSDGDPIPIAFLYTGSIMGSIGTLSGQTTSFAYGINTRGEIVGRSGFAYLYTNGVMTDVNSLVTDSSGWSLTQANAINDMEQIAGYGTNASLQTHAFVYGAGSVADLGTVSGGSGSTSSALGINNAGWTVGVSDGVAFLYMGGQMYDLNTLLINATGGWTLQSATAINDAGKIVGYGLNPDGQVHAFLLNPLLDGAVVAASTVQTSLPPYPTVPTPHKTGLVFITHGWIDKGNEANEITAATNFVYWTSNKIATYLANNGKTDWEVDGHLWTNQADIYDINGGPETALSVAEQIGVNLGNAIVNMGSSRWTNIHFIAHSAGAGMIQKATEVIKASLGDAVTIHCTFLDAYDGALGQMADEYGYEADWSDSYFVRDDFQIAGWTGRVLPNAYNVDVTALDTHASSMQWSGSGGYSCTELDSDHGWPPSFYSNSIAGAIAGSPPVGYYSFGFPLSEEAGVTVGEAKALYAQGNGTSYGTVTNLGSQDGICPQSYLSVPFYEGTVPSWATPVTIYSTTGTPTTPSSGYAIAGTGSPVWLATVITDTNALNYVSFDAKFTSAAGADGLLTVYWDTNMIGEVDETAVQPGLQHYIMQFPNTVANSSHVLGFHVDPFTEVHSTLALTNIVTGCVGVSQPFTLSITTNTIDGLLVYQLTGEPAYYKVQSSPDLVSWTNIAYLANTNGTVNFVDPNSTNYPCQFYRVTAPTMMSQ